MNKLTREEKISKTGDILYMAIGKGKTVIGNLAKKIINAIDPPKIKPGMWGKFWDDNPGSAIFGELLKVYDQIDNNPHLYGVYSVCWKHFKEIPGLKEAIEKLEDRDGK